MFAKISNLGIIFDIDTKLSFENSQERDLKNLKELDRIDTTVGSLKKTIF
jgi:hypothetical protein